MRNIREKKLLVEGRKHESHPSWIGPLASSSGRRFCVKEVEPAPSNPTPPSRQEHGETHVFCGVCCVFFSYGHESSNPHPSFSVFPFTQTDMNKKHFHIRPVTGWGEVVCTYRDIRSVNFCCFLKTSILQLGMVENFKVRQECYRIENHHFLIYS